KLQHPPRRRPPPRKLIPKPVEQHRRHHRRQLLRKDRLTQLHKVVPPGRERTRPHSLDQPPHHRIPPRQHPLRLRPLHPPLLVKPHAGILHPVHFPFKCARRLPRLGL